MCIHMYMLLYMDNYILIVYIVLVHGNDLIIYILIFTVYKVCDYIQISYMYCDNGKDIYDISFIYYHLYTNFLSNYNITILKSIISPLHITHDTYIYK